MLKIGVTGGIGAGKSVICRVFQTLGVPVYNADTRAQLIMDEDEGVRHLLLRAFGKGVFKGGRPDRKALASLVFGNNRALETINGIVHPAVRSDFVTWLEKNSGTSYIVKEAAILFETGAWKELDGTILVTAPVHVRTERIIKRDGITPGEVRRRMESQWPDERKKPLAGMVIVNDDIKPVLPVVLELHYELSRGILPEVFAGKGRPGHEA